MAKKNLDSLVGVMLSKTNEKNGLRLSDVFYVKPSELRPNPMNKVFFKQESGEYFERMTHDIQERGIIVPLIAKNDGTLLAGHNRLEIAQKLSLSKIPVQYLEDKLTEQSEKEFLVKDNIFRRQHSSDEWLNLYRSLYPNFEERIASHGRPTSNKDSDFKDKSDKSAFPTNTTADDKNTTPLTVKKIAEDTGQSTAAVQKQLYRAGLSSASKQNNNTENKKKSNSKVGSQKQKHIGINSKLVSKHQKAVEMFFEKIADSLLNEDPETKKEIIGEIKKCVVNLQQALLVSEK
jgi:hypothetical protein